MALGKSLGEIKDLPNSEIQEWSAYYGIEPFGATRDNWHAGMITSMLANVNRGEKDAPFSIEDFMWQTVAEAEKRAEEAADKEVGKFFDHFDNLKDKGVVH